MEKFSAGDSQVAGLVTSRDSSHDVEMHGHYIVECRDADGNLRWEERIENLVTNEGKGQLLEVLFGGTAKQTYYLGLIGSASYSAVAATDTMAAHAGWTEDQSYSGNRPQPTWAALSGTNKPTTATAFAITGTATIKGCFLTTNATKGGTTGTLYSAGLFSGGDRAVQNGDTLNVTYTASAT